MGYTVENATTGEVVLVSENPWEDMKARASDLPRNIRITPKWVEFRTFNTPPCGDLMRDRAFHDLFFENCIFKNIRAKFVNCQFSDVKISTNAIYEGCTFYTHMPALTEAYRDCVLTPYTDVPTTAWAARHRQVYPGPSSKASLLWNDVKHRLDYGLLRVVTRSDGYTFKLWHMENGEHIITAGCRFFTLEQARAHWLIEYHRCREEMADILSLFDKDLKAVGEL